MTASRTRLATTRWSCGNPLAWPDGCGDDDGVRIFRGAELSSTQDDLGLAAASASGELRG